MTLGNMPNTENIFWNDLLAFLKVCMRKSKQTTKGVIYGAKVYLQGNKDMVAEVVHIYLKEDGQWHEATQKRMIPASEVPAKFSDQVRQAENEKGTVDITQELNMWLSEETEKEEDTAMIFGNNRAHGNMHPPQNKESISDRITAALDRFLGALFAEQPVPFSDFLDSIGEYFDKLIIENSQKEHLHYIGGKLIFTPEGTSNVSQPCSAQITANFYFQNEQNNWVINTIERRVTSNSICDWYDASELKELRAGNAIEFSIDPPNSERQPN